MEYRISNVNLASKKATFVETWLATRQSVNTKKFVKAISDTCLTITYFVTPFLRQGFEYSFTLSFKKIVKNRDSF